MMMRKLWINYKGKQITRCMRNRIENNKLVSINGQTFELVNALAAPVAPVAPVETVTESAPAPVAPVAAPAPVVEIITAPIAAKIETKKSRIYGILAVLPTTESITISKIEGNTAWIKDGRREISRKIKRGDGDFDTLSFNGKTYEIFDTNTPAGKKRFKLVNAETLTVEKCLTAIDNLTAKIKISTDYFANTPIEKINSDDYYSQHATLYHKEGLATWAVALNTMQHVLTTL
jgi:hypothetical protein